MEDALPFAADLVSVLGAWLGDDLVVLVDTPVEFPQAPADRRIFPLLDNAIETELDKEFTDGVDNGRDDDFGGNIGWGEHADRLFVGRGLKGALDSEGACKVDILTESSDGLGAQEVVDLTQGRRGGCWEMAGEEVGERE